MSPHAPARSSAPSWWPLGRTPTRGAGIGQLIIGSIMVLTGVLRLQQRSALTDLDAYDLVFPFVSGLLVVSIGAVTLAEVSGGLSSRPRVVVTTIALLWFTASLVYLVIAFLQAS